ncbi:zinc finger protein [Daldinia childiae]|uniref:zinc finger protein n=1 Tax=Daldinia childiae TaxID=326645 RepID=UPI001447B1A4|nr:zinc finger protein [Daldinia childiae]KAF3065160.1 zinc finger protein [Daldinia childiae]
MSDFDVRNPMSENYKRLLPAPMPPGSQAKAPESAFQKETGPPVKKRTVSKAACNNCRLKKIRCDGKRPACTACSKAGVECNFVTASSDETPFMALKREVESLRRSTEDMLEIFDLLESAPDAVSLDILRRLKSTRNLAEGASDTSDILTSVKKDLEDDPLLPVKLSNRQLMAGLIPETQKTPEYELMIRCPTAYPMLIPVEIAFINLADLLRPIILEPPRVSSLPYNLATTMLTCVRSTGQGDIPSSSSSIVPAGPSEGSIRSGASPTVLNASDREIGNFEPLQSMHTVVDDRLKSVNFQSWTTVPITNELAANLISLYLEIDHPWCPLFDADLFLNDCMQGKTHFCSTLLMNALLGWACQSYSSLQPEAAAYSIAFESEAERLWQVEKFTNTLTAAAAAQFLNSTSASRGRDDFANQCLDEGIQMGKRMGRKSKLPERTWCGGGDVTKMPVSLWFYALDKANHWLC